MRFASISRRRVAYEQYGDPIGQPALIVHGAWGGPSSTLWTGPRLRWPTPTDRLRLIWYDRRCTGWSEYTDADFTLADLAQDAVGMLDYLRIERAAVVATSAGGPIGLCIALDFPERVSALALLNTGAALMHPDPPVKRTALVLDRLSTVRERLAMLNLAEREGVRAAVSAYEQEWRTPPQPAAEDDGLGAFRAHRMRALQRLSDADLARLAAGAIRNMRAQRRIDLTPELGRVAIPTLVLHGDADTTIPIEFGAALAAAIPRAEWLPLKGKSHGLIWDEDAQAIVTEWLSAQ